MLLPWKEEACWKPEYAGMHAMLFSAFAMHMQVCNVCDNILCCEILAAIALGLVISSLVVRGPGNAALFAVGSPGNCPFCGLQVEVHTCVDLYAHENDR